MALKKKVRMSIPAGWQEWCQLPDLGLPAIKAKIDTGARTSALHAFNIEAFKHEGKAMVRFDIHPIQRDKTIVRRCTALLRDRRFVSDSGGHREKRYVIQTPLVIGGVKWDIEITLTNRDTMAFRMLLGRAAMRRRLIVDPSRSFCQGRLNHDEVLTYYN